ncbi:LPXTG cell wall anchor domain-containing protein, partial [Streptomyces sp. NPDC056231]|uniref:LPXTG cell wall anchor domain-containing protein n=1 Tax=Streptomyces sp. NPDC056231 TaxID=3345755 RepID=UPI003AAE9F98
GNGGAADNGGGNGNGGAADNGGGNGNGGAADNGGGNGNGGNGTGGDGGGCTVDLDGTVCADNTDTDSVGNQPVEQGKGKDELAETGAAETTFLLVGAATMIAGGIGFRILPRLVNGRTVA